MSETISIPQFKSFAASGKVSRRAKKGGASIREEFFTRLQYYCNDRNIKIIKEYIVTKGRKWRFDFALPEIKTAIEYEGIFGGGKSRHTNVMGYANDSTKYNWATIEGWRVLRYTATTWRDCFYQLELLISKNNL